uniref:Uncharacterized protein n=1 Tax=Anguilla anguilla TaxID=7936 RepID=A0A0E9TSG8_ANGAN
MQLFYSLILLALTGQTNAQTHKKSQ